MPSISVGRQRILGPPHRFLVGLAILLAIVTIGYLVWPKGPTPYYAPSINVVQALRAGDFEEFEKGLMSNTFEVQRIDQSTLRRVFHSYLCPLYQQGQIRPSWKVDEREFGKGTAFYILNIPEVKDEVRIGWTAEFDGTKTGVRLEHIILQSFEIQAAKDGILFVQGGRQIRNYSPKLKALGMNGVCRTGGHRPDQYFTWDEYAAAFDKLAENDRSSGD